MKRVLIQAEANEKIGWGHMMRMVALADMLSLHFEILFASNSEVDIEHKIFSFDEREFLEQINSQDIVILDGYNYSISFQKKIKSKGSRLVCIDDFQHTKYYADLVINHAPGILESQIEGQSYTKYLLGPKYAMLRFPFLMPCSLTKRKIYNTALICLGGSDPKDISFQVTSALLNLDLKQLVLILGKNYSGKCVLMEDSRLTKMSSLSAEEMREQVRSVDFAVVSASTILLECASQGTPTITGHYVDNQKRIYDGFVSQNLSVGIGDFQSGSIDFEKSIERLDQLNLDALNKIFDGKIQERMVNSFREL